MPNETCTCGRRLILMWWDHRTYDLLCVDCQELSTACTCTPLEPKENSPCPTKPAPAAEP